MQTPPVTGDDVNLVLKWIPTATLLYVVWVAARLHKTVQDMRKELSLLRRRSHRMATLLTILSNQPAIDPDDEGGEDRDD